MDYNHLVPVVMHYSLPWCTPSSQVPALLMSFRNFKKHHRWYFSFRLLLFFFSFFCIPRHDTDMLKTQNHSPFLKGLNIVFTLCGILKVPMFMTCDSSQLKSCMTEELAVQDLKILWVVKHYIQYFKYLEQWVGWSTLVCLYQYFSIKLDLSEFDMNTLYMSGNCSNSHMTWMQH